MSQPRRSSLPFQILATLSYTDQFQYPLSSQEIWQRLVSGTDEADIFSGRETKIRSQRKKRVSLSQVEKSLALLVKENQVSKNSDWYVLKGSELFFMLRKQRKVFSQQKKKEIQQFLRFVPSIPWILGVAVTGGQAMENVSFQKDDIDFLIVTAKKRLWLVRPLVIFLSFLNGKKVLGGQKDELGRVKRDRWCFNLWLDETHLQLPRKKRNFYTAYEVGQTHWVFERKNSFTKQRFFSQNRWIIQYVPHMVSFEMEESEAEKKRLSSGDMKGLWLEGVWAFLNKVGFLLQFGYLRWKVHFHPESASPGTAYLHLGDMKKIVYNRWRDSLKKSIGTIQ